MSHFLKNFLNMLTYVLDITYKIKIRYYYKHDKVMKFWTKRKA